MRHILFLMLISFQTFGQEVPKVKFNHLFFIVDANDLSAINNSDFIRNKLTAVDIDTLKANNDESWTGTYLFGIDNYLEFFDSLSFGNTNEGISGLGFSVDNIGEINTVKEIFNLRLRINYS